MPLEAYLNTYAGNPLDRAGDRRADAAWIAAQAAAPGALALALWNGRPLVETAEGGGVRIAYRDWPAGQRPCCFWVCGRTLPSSPSTWKEQPIRRKALWRGSGGSRRFAR